MNVLDFPPIAAIRRNHALEHATVHILTERNPNLQLIGRSSLGGFAIYGKVETAAVEDAVHTAIARLQAGDTQLAVHPFCGTNVLTTGLLAGLAAFGVTLRRTKSKWDKLPDMITAATLAALVAQPLGLIMQSKVTTSSAVAGTRITAISHHQRGNLIIHRIKTAYERTVTLL